MKKYKVFHKDRKAIYFYFLSSHGNEYVLSILYYDKKGNGTDNDKMPSNYKVQHIVAVTEEDTITAANHWVKANLGSNFHIDEV